MKKLICLLLVFALVTACGAPADSELGSTVEPEYTEEELFLQRAYWYLQSDEKDLFSWENGQIEQYCSEEPHPVIGPTGELDIQGRELTQVKYVYVTPGDTLEGILSLYFDGDEFVGTDDAMWFNGSQFSQYNLERYWDGDLSLWVFLDGPEYAMDDTITVTCVLRNGGEPRTLWAFSPKVADVEFYQNGKNLVAD